MATASKEEILKHLDSIDLNELLDRMENYVRDRFYNKSDKIREGFDYLDFCYNVLIKACDGIRKWDKDKISFEEFVFGTLKSDLYNFFRKLRNKDKKDSDADEDEDDTDIEVTQEVYIIEVNEFIDLSEFESEDEPPDIDFDDITNDTLTDLKGQGADRLEMETYECWLAGYYKPQEIAELCNTTAKEVNNAVKRLSRKTIKLQEKWISLKK